MFSNSSRMGGAIAISGSVYQNAAAAGALVPTATGA